jgi:hypothetical protein
MSGNFRIDILSGDELYQRVRTERSNRDLFAEREIAGSHKKARRLHYLSSSEYHKQVNVTVSLGSRIVAIGGIQTNPSDTRMLWVCHVSVEEKHQGKGLARMVIEAIYAYAVAQGQVVSPSAFSALGQRLKPIFVRLNQQFPAACSGEEFRDHLC